MKGRQEEMDALIDRNARAQVLVQALPYIQQ